MRSVSRRVRVDVVVAVAVVLVITGVFSGLVYDIWLDDGERSSGRSAITGMAVAGDGGSGVGINPDAGIIERDGEREDSVDEHSDSMLPESGDGLSDEKSSESVDEGADGNDQGDREDSQTDTGTGLNKGYDGLEQNGKLEQEEDSGENAYPFSALSSNIQEDGADGSDYGVQASCTVWPCACGDEVEGSITLTSNLTGCQGSALVIKNSNIVVDCDGYSIIGIRDPYGNDKAFYANSFSDVVIKNCNVRNFGIGFHGVSVSGLIVNNSNFTNISSSGIRLDSSSGNFVLGNSVDLRTYTPGGGQIGIYVQAANATYSGYNIVANNTLRNGQKGYLGAKDMWTNITNNTFVNFSSAAIEYDSFGGNNNVSFNLMNSSATGVSLGLTDGGIYPASYLLGNLLENVSTGFYLYYSSYHRFINNKVVDSSGGFSFFYSSRNNITNLTLINTSSGLTFQSVFWDSYTNSYNNLSNSNLTNVSNPFAFSLGLAPTPILYQYIDASNTADGKTIYYLWGENGATINQDSNPALVYLIDSNYSTVANVTIGNSSQYGLFAVNSHSANITNVSVNFTETGIYLWQTVNMSLINVTAHNNSADGVYLYGANSTTVQNLTSYSNENVGLYLNLASRNNITNSSVYDNGFQFRLDYTVATAIDTLNHTFENVTLGSKHLAYFYGVNHRVVNQTNNTGVVFASFGENITIKGLDVRSNQSGAKERNHRPVLFYQVNYSTINNSYFGDSSQGVGYSLDIDYSNNLTIYNNTFNYTGIDFTYGSNVTFFNNSLIEPIIPSSGGAVSYSNYLVNSQLRNNYIVGFDINLFSVENVTFLDNWMENGSIINTWSTNLVLQNNNLSNGIFRGTSIISNNITNASLSADLYVGNIIKHLTSEATVTGNFSNNTVLWGDGVTLFYSDSYVLNNTFANITGTAVAIGPSSDRNFFDSNTYINNTQAYQFREHPSHNLLVNENLTGNFVGVGSTINLFGEMWLILNQPKDNISWRNSHFSNNTYDLNLTGSIMGDNFYFINTTYNRSRANVGSLVWAYSQWFVDVNVTNRTTGLPLSGVNVTAYLYNGSMDYSNLTDSQGIARMILSEQFRQSNINYILTDHTIMAFLGGYTKNSTVLDLRNTTGAMGYINLTLGHVSCGDVLMDDLVMGEDMYCTGDGLYVNRSDIVIEGGGYTIYGKQNGVGIDIENSSGVVVGALNVRNFTVGVQFVNGNFSNMTNASISNNTYGVMFNNSRGNSIVHAGFYNASWGVSSTAAEALNNSLVNATIGLANVSAQGLSKVYNRWLVDVNVSLSSYGQPLQGATINATFNSTGVVDKQGTTGAGGNAVLEVSELLWNSSGYWYLTPHNISAMFTTASQTEVNSTIINLTQTNNTRFTLNLSLDCQVPYTGMNIQSDIEFCPGTYRVASIIFGNDAVNVTCSQTTLVATDSFDTLFFSTRDDIGIIGCTTSGYKRAVYLETTDRAVLTNNTFLSCDVDSAYSSGAGCVDLYFSHEASIYNNTFNGASLRLYLSNYAKIHRNNFLGSSTSFYGIAIDRSSGVNITNSSFDDIPVGVRFDGWELGQRANLSVIYNNTFTDSSQYHLKYYDIATQYDAQNGLYYNLTDVNASLINSLNLTINWSENISARGNSWDDYCNKGTDGDGDGYADNVSASGEWPYNSSTSTKISGELNDFGPKIQTCIEEVQVAAPGSTVSAGGSSSSKAPAAAAAETTVVEAAKESPIITRGQKKALVEENKQIVEAVYGASDVRKYLKREVVAQKTKTGAVKVVVKLENTGTKEMRLLPEIFQEIDDPFFIVTRKTLGGEGSLFEEISHLSYSRSPIAGRLMKATIVNPEQIILQPGESIDKVIEIKEGFGASKKIKIQFTTVGESVFEEDITEKTQGKAFTGSAVDVDTEADVIDIYTLFVSEELTGRLEEYYAKTSDEITGSAVSDVRIGDQAYFLELDINKLDVVDAKSGWRRMPGMWGVGPRIVNFNGKERGETSFSDRYGPYRLAGGQSFIFAQQLKYDSSLYKGGYMVKARVYKGEVLLIENEFEVQLE